jgi:hypothetical protein
MTEQNIYDIIKMRMAVYKAGVKAGFWERRRSKWRI